MEALRYFREYYIVMRDNLTACPGHERDVRYCEELLRFEDELSRKTPDSLWVDRAGNYRLVFPGETPIVLTPSNESLAKIRMVRFYFPRVRGRIDDYLYFQLLVLEREGTLLEE